MSWIQEYEHDLEQRKAAKPNLDDLLDDLDVEDMDVEDVGSEPPSIRARCPGCGIVRLVTELGIPFYREWCSSCGTTYRLVDLAPVAGDFWMVDSRRGCNARSYELAWDARPIWAAFCRCGWHGHAQDSEASADQDADQHRVGSEATTK